MDEQGNPTNAAGKKKRQSPVGKELARGASVADKQASKGGVGKS